MTEQLVRYDAMCRAIEMAHRVDEVKDIRDKAVALQHYARQALNTDAERRASEIRLRAERKAGQLLKKMPKVRNQHSRSSETTGTLETLGITKDQSSQWQRLAAMPQREFDLAIGESIRPPTTRGILRTTAPPEDSPVVESDALWLWGRLRDFERNGLLEKEPADVIQSMTEPMKDTVHQLAPKVAAWLKRIGALK